MLEPDGSPNTAHSTNPVPLIVTAGGLSLDGGGVLADVAPTALALLGIEQPAEMTGRSLLTAPGHRAQHDRAHCLPHRLPGRAQRPGTPSIRDNRARRSRPDRAAPPRQRRGRDAGVHPACDARQRSLAGGRGGRRARLPAGLGQHLPPDAVAGPGANRGARRPASVHGLGAPDHHRLRRLPGLLARPRPGRRRDQGAARAPARAGEGARDRRAGGSLPLVRGRIRAVPGPRGVDGGAGGARLRHRPRLRRVHALPRRSRLHRPLDGAHPPLAGPLPRLARAPGAAPPGGVRDRPGRACTRTSAAPRPSASRRRPWTASRSGGRWAGTRRRCAACSG